MAILTHGMMVDIETLSTRPNAAIVSIGACRYDVKKGIFDKFYVTIDAQDSKNLGFHIDKDTIAWWEKQPREARLAWQKGGIPVAEAMKQFFDYVNPKEVNWSWGATFDFPILNNAFRVSGLPEPWKYWNCLCARTAGSLLDIEPNRDKGTYHNALDDAIVQAEMMIQIFQ